MGQPLNVPGDLRHALKLARKLGCKVEPVVATDEIRITSPHGGSVKLKITRKDTARALVVLLRNHAKRQAPRNRKSVHRRTQEVR